MTWDDLGLFVGGRYLLRESGPYAATVMETAGKWARFQYDTGSSQWIEVDDFAESFGLGMTRPPKIKVLQALSPLWQLNKPN